MKRIRLTHTVRHYRRENQVNMTQKVLAFKNQTGRPRCIRHVFGILVVDRAASAIRRHYIMAVELSEVATTAKYVYADIQRKITIGTIDARGVRVRTA